MEVHNKFYEIGLKRIYGFLDKITKGVDKETNTRQGFVVFIIRDIDNAEGNIDLVGNLPQELTIDLLEEALNTIKTKGD